MFFESSKCKYEEPEPSAKETTENKEIAISDAQQKENLVLVEKKELTVIRGLDNGEKHHPFFCHVHLSFIFIFFFSSTFHLHSFSTQLI